MLEFTGLYVDAQPTETLRQWLSDKPFEWAPALATRATFRSLPWAFENCSESWIERFALPSFHALFVAYSTSANPVKGHKHAAELSSNLLYPAAMDHERQAYFASALRHIQLAIQAKNKLDKIDHSVRSIMALQNLAKGIDKSSEQELLNEINRDAIYLESSSKESNDRSRALMKKDIIISGNKNNWLKHIENSIFNITKFDKSFVVWTDWLRRAAGGKNLNFIDDFTMVDARAKDRQVEMNIIQQIDGLFWSRIPKIVNNDVMEFVSSSLGGDKTGGW